MTKLKRDSFFALEYASCILIPNLYSKSEQTLRHIICSFGCNQQHNKLTSYEELFCLHGLTVTSIWWLKGSLWLSTKEPIIRNFLITYGGISTATFYLDLMRRDEPFRTPPFILYSSIFSQMWMKCHRPVNLCHKSIKASHDVWEPLCSLFIFHVVDNDTKDDYYSRSLCLSIQVLDQSRFPTDVFHSGKFCLAW